LKAGIITARVNLVFFTYVILLSVDKDLLNDTAKCKHASQREQGHYCKCLVFAIKSFLFHFVM